MISISAESQPGTVESKPPGASCVYVEIQQWVTHLLGNPRNVSTLCIYSWRSWCVNGWSDVAVYEVDMASHAMINRDLGGSTRSHLCCKDLGIFVFFFFWFFGSCLVFELMQKPEVSEESEWRTHFFEGSTKLENHFFPQKTDQQKNRRKTQFFSRTLISEFSEICLGHCCWLSWSSRIWRNVEDTGSLRNVEMTEHHWKKLQIPTNLLHILQILGC